MQKLYDCLLSVLLGVTFFCNASEPFVSSEMLHKAAKEDKKKLQQKGFKRLIAVLEEQSPELQKPFIENAGKILLGLKLKAADKKAIQVFLKKVATDADLLPADKKAIDRFFKRGLSTGAKIGIGVGSAAAMTALIAMAVVAARSGISRGMSSAPKAFSGAENGGSANGIPVPPADLVARAGVGDAGAGSGGVGFGDGAGADTGAGAAGGDSANAGRDLESVATGVMSRLSSSPVWVNPLVLYSDGTMHGHIQGPDKVIRQPGTVNGAGVGAHTEAGTGVVSGGAGSGAGDGGVMDSDQEIDATKLFAPDNLCKVCLLGEEIEHHGGLVRRDVIAGSGDVLGLHKNADLKSQIEHSYVQDSHKVRAYVGHLSDSKGSSPLKVRGEEIGRTDQDAFRIEILPSGKLRVVVADGSGCAALYGWSAQHVTPDCTCDSARCLFAEGGSGVAKAAIATIVSGKSIREGSDALKTQWRLYDSIHECLVDFDHTNNSFDGAKADPVFAQLFGGQAMVSCLELDSIQKRVRCDTVGDTGAVLFRVGGSYEVIGKSEHENLGGRHRRNLVFGGDSSSDCVVDSSERIIIEAGQFIIVACDGFWDAFGAGSKDSKGNVLVRPLSAPDVYRSIVAAINTGKNPGQALAALAQSYGSKDDITVVVIDLRPLCAGAGAGAGTGAGDADEIIELVRELGLPQSQDELAGWMAQHPYENQGAVGYATDRALGVFLKQDTKLHFFHEGLRGGRPMLLVPNISAPTWKWQKDVLDFLKEIKDGHRTVMF